MYVWCIYGSAEIRATEYIVEVRGQFSGVSSLRFLRVYWIKLKNSVVQEELYPLILTNAKFFSL